MSRTPFLSARLKAKWAKRHISEFQNLIRVFIDSDICKISSKRHSDGGDLFHVEAKPLPPEFSLIIGDTVNCIRNALDHVTSQIVAEISGKRSRAKFPTHETRDSLIESLSRSPVKEAFPEFEGIILDVINPCRDGNNALWLAGRLNNIDKHQEIMVTAGITDAHLELVIDKNKNIIRNITIRLSNGAWVTPIKLNAPFKVYGKITPTVEVLFGPVEGLDKNPVLPLLFKMSQSLDNAIETIEAEYLRY